MRCLAIAMICVAAGCGYGPDTLPPRLGTVSRGEGSPGQRDVRLMLSGPTIVEPDELTLRAWPEMTEIAASAMRSTETGEIVITPTIELAARWYAIWFQPEDPVWASGVHLPWQSACRGIVQPFYNPLVDGARLQRVELFDATSGAREAEASIRFSEEVCAATADELAASIVLSQAGEVCTTRPSEPCAGVFLFDCSGYLDRIQGVALQVMSGLQTIGGVPFVTVDISFMVDALDGRYDLEEAIAPTIAPEWAPGTSCPD